MGVHGPAGRASSADQLQEADLEARRSAAGLGSVQQKDLRDTHASLLIAQGEHPKVISERLGRSSIKVTFDVYGHLMPGLDDAVADRLDDAWLEAIGGETRTRRAPNSIVDLDRSRRNPN